MQNPLIEKIENLRTDFDSVTKKLVKDLERERKIRDRHDRQQQKEHDELEFTIAEVIFSMGVIGESRSKETGNHVKRVAEYSALFAEYLGLDEKVVKLLRDASPLHDMGKVAIPDSILNKPGRFNEEEFLIMQSHATLGYNLLKDSESKIMKAAATIAHQHHEKWNGKGYPQGLAGEDIHIFGRIVALADVFDALGSARCYKPAWEDDRIFKLFAEERGQHFDPQLVDIFLEHKAEFLAIRDSLQDSFDEESTTH